MAENHISPQQTNSSSACEITSDTFRNYCVVKQINDLKHLQLLDMPPPPEEWKNFGNIFKKEEKHMNALIQRKLTAALSGHGQAGNGLEIEQDNTVKEKSMSNLLPMCYQFSDDEKKLLKKRNQMGLPLSMHSQPDIAVWNKMLLVCEGKNKATYSLDDAIRQCSCYMLIHLHILLSYKSSVVEDIYGIAFAGSNCKRNKDAEYEIVLLRLQLPELIGHKLVMYKYPITDLAVLHSFVNHACIPSIDSHILNNRKLPPAALQMPRGLLADENVMKEDSLELILNGTGNLIIRVCSADAWNDLNPFLGDFYDEDQISWTVSEEERNEIGYPFYFKSKNHLACPEPKNQGFFRIDNGTVQDIDNAYMIDPFVHGNGMYWCIKDMGTVFCPRKLKEIETSCQYLKLKLSSFMERVLHEQKDSRVIHGDIHMNNLVYSTNDDNEVDFHLIDYDEALIGAVVTRRLTCPHHIYMYNIHFISESKYYESFTKQQLILLFFKCYKEFIEDDENADNLKALEESFCEFLEKGDRTAEKDNTIIKNMYDELVSIIRNE